MQISAYFVPFTASQKSRLAQSIRNTVLHRTPKMCNILDYKGSRPCKLVYRRYASLYFIVGFTDERTNELIVLEKIHFLVEVLDRYFGNVCELDIIFNFHRAYICLYSVFTNGYMLDTSKGNVINELADMDRMVEEARAKTKDWSNEENGLSFQMQMQLGRRPTKQINHALSF